MSIEEARELYGLLGSLAAAMEEDRYAGADIVKRAAAWVWERRNVPALVDECMCSPIKQEYCHAQGCKGGSMLGEFGIKRQPAACYTCGLTGKHDEECSAARRKEPDTYEVPVKQLVTGDSVYSPSSDSWHEVRRASSGQLYFERDGAWRPVSFGPDVLFLTRRGETGAAADALFDALGGEVIEDGE